jgi:hypothetical protein
MTKIDMPTPDDKTFSIDDWIAGATRPETVITLSSKGAEYGRFKSLEVELLAANKAAADNPDDRLISVSAGEPLRIATQMDALAKVIDAGRHPFRLRGLSEADLKSVRIASKDLDEDATNELLLSICCVDPVLTPAKWGALRQAVGEGQWMGAVNASNRITFGETVDVPFSLAASVALKTAAS